MIITIFLFLIEKKIDKFSLSLKTKLTDFFIYFFRSKIVIFIIMN